MTILLLQLYSLVFLLVCANPAQWQIFSSPSWSRDEPSLSLLSVSRAAAVLSLSLVLLAHFPSSPAYFACVGCCCCSSRNPASLPPLASRHLELFSLCRYVFYSCLFLIAFSLGEATLAPPAGERCCACLFASCRRTKRDSPPSPITYTYIHTYMYTHPRNSTRLDWSVRSPIHHWPSRTRFESLCWPGMQMMPNWGCCHCCFVTR